MSFQPPTRRNLKAAKDKRGGRGAEATSSGSENAGNERAAAANALCEGRLRAMLEEFDESVKERCDLMLQRADDLAQSLSMQLHFELMKLSSSVRAMPMRRFCEMYDCDVNQMIRAEVDRQMRSARGLSDPDPEAAAVAPIVLSVHGDDDLELGNLAAMQAMDAEARRQAFQKLSMVRKMLDEKMQQLMNEF